MIAKRKVQPWLAGFGVAGLLVCWLVPAIRSWEQAPDLGHSWIVPVLMAYLWWERWDERPAGRSGAGLRWGWWIGAGVIAVLLAVPMQLLLVPYPVWPFVLTAYTGLLAGVALLAAALIGGRPAVAWTAAPLILLLSALPIPGVVEQMLIIPLRGWLAVIAAELCNLLGMPAMVDGTSVRLASGWVGIDEACGGIRSLQACLMIGLFFGAWYRFRWWRRVALALLGFGMALAGNFARVLFLSLQAGSGVETVHAVHDVSGWVAMIGSLVATGWLGWHWAGYRWPETKPAARPSGPAIFAPGWIWLAGVTAGLLGGAGAVQAWYAGGAVDRSAVPQWTVRLPEARPSFVAEPLSKPAREMLRPDHYSAGSWRMAAGDTAAAYYIEWHGGQVARSAPFVHNPTVCLPFAGCELVEQLDPVVVTWAGGKIPFQVYKFRRLGRNLLVMFTIWDPTLGQPLNEPDATPTWASWWRDRWQQVALARRDQPAQMFTLSLFWQEQAPEMIRRLAEDLIVPETGAQGL